MASVEVGWIALAPSRLGVREYPCPFWVSTISRGSGSDCRGVVAKTGRPSGWQNGSTRTSFTCRGFFSDLKSSLMTRLGGGGEDARKSSAPQIPPVWPLEDEDEVEQDFDGETIKHEVNAGVELDESVLKELASKGATEVRVENVVKVFQTSSGRKTVVENISLRIQPGQLVALVGPSGSGKTTLLRMLAGLEPTTSGKIYFNGEDLTNVRVQDRDVGFMFQSYALFKHMTVAANVGYGLSTSKRKGSLTPEQVKKRVKDMLELVQLGEYGERYPPQLSGGQRQRVALARALATEPRILLLDEPFGALDIVVREELRSWVKQLQKKLNITTIFVTHDQDEALEMADYMVVFHQGRILQEGAPFDIHERPNSAFVMNFVSDPNILPSTCLAVQRSGLRTDLPNVLVRPDDIEFFYEEMRDLPTTPATVMVVNDMGPQVACEIKFDDGVTLEFTRQRYDFEEQPLEVGQRVHLQLKPLLLKAFSPNDLKP